MRTCIAEQRREERESAVGEVWLILEGGRTGELVGRLLDSSQSGFRALHNDATLSTGQRVRFSYHGRQGRALVMWNRILNRGTESGFLILDEQSGDKKVD
jgi:hypothetical protein